MLARHTMLERRLQPRLEILGLQGAGGLCAARQLVADALELLRRQFAAGGDLLQPALRFALRELGLAPLALGAVDPLTLLAQRTLGQFELMPGKRHRLAPFLDPLALRLDRVLGEQQALALVLFLDGHLAQAVVDLRLPLAQALLRLRQLQRLDLDRVRPVLQQAELVAGIVQRLLRFGKRLLDGRQRGLRAPDVPLVLGDDARQLLDFALPLEQPMGHAVSCEQGHALPADDVAAGRHATRTRRQPGTGGQRARQIGCRQHLAKPVAEDRRQRRVGAADAGQQLVGGHLCRWRRRRQRQHEGLPAARPIPAPRRVGALGRQRREPLAQHRLDRVLPAGLDLQRPPQRLAMLQTVPAQPFIQLAIRLQALLQLLQRAAAGIRLGTLLLRLLHFAKHLPPLLLEARLLLLSLLHDGLCLADAQTQGGQLFLLVGNRRGVGQRHRLPLQRQALAPAGDDLQRALRMPAVGLLDAQVLLHLRQRRALAVELVERSCLPALGQRQAFMARSEALPPLLDTFVGDDQKLLPAFAFARQLRRLSLPVRPVIGELGETRLVLAPRFTPVTDLGLQTRHLGVGGKQPGLRRMDAIAGAEVRLARLLEARLEFAQRAVLRLEIEHRPRHLARQPLTFELRLVAPQQPQQLLPARQLVVVLAILAGDTGLRFEPLHLVAQFDTDVLDARQVFARVGEPVLGLLAPFLVARDARRFFQEHPQLVGFRLDDARDRSLADDRVGARAEAGAEEQVGDVLAPHVQVVDVVLGLAATRQQALDRKFGILRPLAGEAPERIVEDQLDGSARHRLARARAVEDHVLHRFATQLGGLRLAEHPAHRIDHVRLAAAVRSDDADQLPGQRQRRRIDEGLEAGKFQSGETHELARGDDGHAKRGGQGLAVALESAGTPPLQQAQPIGETP
ncbi:MAG: hypothetical protein AW08_03646 [Candidatus Accumulibacter adjunctus]|uniref:Uncharacterized protein n=1 Tax=Candidatus Accumulibacter adjunctus TaxID=1454001 RepID=A0A011NJ23_9PROT|nr:MAG: hypothetical protein AW08_03646 [Candidatus Accumulibacter adjunctus]